MTLTGIGPFWLYQSTSFIFSLTTNEKQADESLTRIYICNYQTLLINRAGKHHRGFYPSSCFRNCSLFIFTHTGHAQYHFSKHQPQWIFYLHSKNTNHSILVPQFFVGLHKKRCLVLSAVLGSICLSLSTYPPTILQNVGPFCLTFDLAIIAVVVSFVIVLLIKMSKSIQWLEHSLLCFINCDFFVLLFASPNIYIQNWILLLLLGAFRVLGNFYYQQQLPCNSATPRNPSHDNDNLWMTKSFARYLIGCFKEIKFV